MNSNNDNPNDRRRRQPRLEDLSVEDLEMLSRQIQKAIIEARRNCEIMDKIKEHYSTGSMESIGLSDHEVSDGESAIVEIDLENSSVRYTESGSGEEKKCHSVYYVRDSIEFEEVAGDNGSDIQESAGLSTNAKAENDDELNEVSVNQELTDPVYAIPAQTSAPVRRETIKKKRSVSFAMDDQEDGEDQGAAEVQNAADDHKPLMPQYVLYEFPNLDRYFFTMMAICIGLALGFLWIFIGSITH